MKLSFCVLFLFFSPARYFASAQQKNNIKPNILWITFEDTSPQFIGAYGNADARTPNMDLLAKNGVRFTNAFSTGTVCSPSRSCIITGVKTYSLGTGHHRSNIRIPDYIKGFPFYLHQQGYYTTNHEKTDYNIANAKDFVQQTWDESSGEAGWWKRQPGQPFFAVFNFMDSHQSRTMTWPYAQYKKEVYDHLTPEERIGDNDFSLPPIYHESPEMRKQFARVYNSLKKTDNEIGALLQRLDVDHLRDSTIIFLYADHGEGMPRGKTNGINYGYRVPFVIWFPPMYSHLSPWGKAGVVTDELIDFEDLAPTMLSLCGSKVPEYMKGRILLGNDRSPQTRYLFLSNDRADNGPDLTRTVTDGRYVYSRNFMPFEPEMRYIRYVEISEIKQQMREDYSKNLLDSFQRTLFYARPPEMLYDIANDPWEMHNLAGDKQCAEKLREFRDTLDHHIISERDVLLLPEYATNQIPASTTLYEFRQDDKNFPVQQIYKVASLSGFRNVKVAQQQIDFLKDNNPVIRYWAILGLRSQRPGTLQKFKSDIEAAIDDSYPPVAVTAAAIVYDNFKSQKAENILKDAIGSSNMDIALMAINYLLYAEDASPFVETVRKIKSSSDNYNAKAAANDFLGKLNLVENDAAHEAE